MGPAQNKAARLGAAAKHTHAHYKQSGRFNKAAWRDQHYELLKSQLTASARTPAEYDAAVREAARRVGV